MDYNIKVVDTLKVIIAKHGVEILNDSSKCSSMFGDYEPKLYRERRLLNNVLSTGIALQLQNHNSMTDFDIMNELTHARQAVLETYFCDPYSTDIMINSIMASLGINVMLAYAANFAQPNRRS